MGAGLKKTFFAFESLVDPAGLLAWKEMSNQWEVDYQRLGKHAEPRPLNLDPGYLTEAKLILASTKDRDHRIYLISDWHVLLHGSHIAELAEEMAERLHPQTATTKAAAFSHSPGTPVG